MRYRTELMRRILKSDKAQEIIDYVSPIYGESYVGLWIYQAIGTVLGEICDIAEKLRYETNAGTADLLLDYWESHYAIPYDSSLTQEQRRAQLIARTQSRGSSNPAKLEAAISAALGGVDVKITERVAKNAFRVNIQEVVPDIKPAIAVLERMKPAHLIYQIQVVTDIVSEADLKTAIAATYVEYFKVEVQQ